MSTAIVTRSITSITTVELLAHINEYRAEDGKRKLRNDQFLDKVRDELDLDEMVQSFCTMSDYHKSTTVEGYTLTHDQALLVGMRESKGVRKKVLEYLRRLEQEILDWQSFRLQQQDGWRKQSQALAETTKDMDPRKRGLAHANATDLIHKIVTGMRKRELVQCPSRVCREDEDPDVGLSYYTSEELALAAELFSFHADLITAGADNETRKALLTNKYNAMRVKGLR